jgi:ubiquinone/menaquinone biosynthesis C-methylase UbiE
MDHADHVALIREGVSGAGRRWLELGAGQGAFTLALADLLGPGGEILAVDRDAGDLRHMSAALSASYPAVAVTTLTGDFERPMDLGGLPFDGLLAANALHFVRDPAAVVARLRPRLLPDARVIVVEYDADRGNPWVPHPFSFATWETIAVSAGLTGTRLIGRVPSRFLGAIYAAASEFPAWPDAQRDQATSTDSS